jgi:hypothetical protein
MNINTKSIYNENGSIFTVLLGGIAMVALISLAAYQLMSGPLASASRLTQNNMVNTQLPSIGHIAIMDAANIGDCDADGYTEARPWRAATGPVVPGNGGLIPLAMGAPTLDPWGTEYGYCTWDIGPTSADAGCGGLRDHLEVVKKRWLCNVGRLWPVVDLAFGAGDVFPQLARVALDVGVVGLEHFRVHRELHHHHRHYLPG